MTLVEKIFYYLEGKPTWAVTNTEGILRKRYERSAFQLYYMDKLLLIYTFYWLYHVWQAYYYRYALIAKEDFRALSPLADYLLDTMLVSNNWQIVFFITLISSLLLLRFSGIVLLRLLLFVGVVLLNLPAENYSYHGHGDRFFFLLLFLSILLKSDYRNRQFAELYYQHQMQRAFWLAVLFTYCLAGFWKLYPMLLYHPWNQYYGDGFITWVSPDALWLESLANLLSRDLNPTPAVFLYEWRYVMVISVWLTILVQFLSPIAAFRNYWLMFFIPILVLFHNVTYWLMGINFPNKFLLVIVFFPYHIFSRAYWDKPQTQHNFTGKGLAASYQKVNPLEKEEEENLYRGAYAYRAFYTDKWHWLSFFWQIPFFCTFMELYWQLRDKLRH